MTIASNCKIIETLMYGMIPRAKILIWLNARPLVYLGSVSYTVYLSHHLILLGLARHAPQWGWLPLTLAGAALTLLLAEPMRRWVEQPCATLRRRLHYPRLAHETVPEFRFVGTP